MIDRLESRLLLAGSISNRVLRILGGPDADIINVEVGIHKTKVTYVGDTENFSTADYDSILIEGGLGNDWIECGGNFNRQGTINGGGGNDTISGSQQAETLNGGEGDDVICYQLSDVVDREEPGADEYFFGTAPSDPHPTLVNGILRYTGTNFRETIVLDVAQSSTMLHLAYSGGFELFDIADVQSVIINGRGGSDRIQINSGVLIPTRLYGGAGNDTILGGSGVDRVYGGDGNDWITGNAGNDVINGENGSDRIFGGTGRDYIVGGPGSDLLRGESGVDQILANTGLDDFRGNAEDLITLL